MWLKAASKAHATAWMQGCLGIFSAKLGWNLNSFLQNIRAWTKCRQPCYKVTWMVSSTVLNTVLILTWNWATDSGIQADRERWHTPCGWHGSGDTWASSFQHDLRLRGTPALPCSVGDPIRDREDRAERGWWKPRQIEVDCMPHTTSGRRETGS
jgi:hypothetical protein